MLIPVVGMTLKRIPVRFIIAFGFFVMGCSMLYSSKIVPGIDFTTLVLMRSSQTAGLAFLFVPISQVAFLTLPQHLRSDGSAIYSMFRNVAGSIGISVRPHW